MNKLEAIQPLFSSRLAEAATTMPHPKEWGNDAGVNVVFGIPHQELPARFLAGLVPAIAFIETVNQNAELRIFVPLHLALHTGVSPVQAERKKQQGLLFIQKFQTIFHPELTWFVDVDKPMTQTAIEFLIKLSDQLPVQNPEIQSAWESILSSARRRGDEKTAKVYGPHHIFGWQDCHEPNLFFEQLPKTITINVMSTAERPFRLVRQAVVRGVEKNHSEILVHGHHLDLETALCRRPHYLRVSIKNTQEPSLDDLLLAGFQEVHRELTGQAASGVSKKFREALKDLESVDNHIRELRQKNINMPTIEEFIQEVRHAAK